MSVPADLESERALITACLLSKKAFLDVTASITPEHFYAPKHQHIWQAFEQCAPDTNDPILVAARLRANGLEGDDYTVTGMNSFYCDPNIPATCTSHAKRYALAIVNEAARRGIIMAIAEGAENAQTGIAVAITRDDLISKLSQISTSTETVIPISARELADSVNGDYNWLVRDFLERGERLMITGSEGAGKSELVAQIGFMVAAGLHPWTQKSLPPIRVLLVDLENNPRKVVRRIRIMEHAVAEAERHGELSEPWDHHRMMIEPRAEGIDLTSATDRDWLASLCEGSGADLLIIGPAYRMSKGVPERGDLGGEDQARQISAAIDQIRQRLDLTVIIEAHAPHGATTGGRDLRPFGSSVWLRWPDFGRGLRPVGASDPRAFTLDPWRRDRDEREWPKMLIRNSTPWPWVADMG